MNLIDSYILIQDTKREIIESSLCISLYTRDTRRCLSKDCVKCKKETLKSISRIDFFKIIKNNQEVNNVLELKKIKYNLYNYISNHSESICWKHIIDNYRVCIKPEAGQCQSCLDEMFNEYGEHLFFRSIITNLDNIYESGIIKLVAQQLGLCAGCSTKCTDNNCKKRIRKMLKSLLI